MPHVHAMEDVYGKDIKFTALNTTKARRLAIGQKILGLPVIALYKGGEKIAECVKDDATVENIEAMIKPHLRSGNMDRNVCCYIQNKIRRK